MPVVTLQQASKPAQELFKKGKVALDRQNLDYAIDMFQSCVEREPGFLDARELLRSAEMQLRGRKKGGKFSRLFASVSVMGARGELTEAKIFEIAKKLGIDPEMVKVARQAPSVRQQLDQNMDLARNLQINGTPAFIVAGQLVPGAIDLDGLRQLVAKARAG